MVRTRARLERMRSSGGAAPDHIPGSTGLWAFGSGLWHVGVITAAVLFFSDSSLSRTQEKTTREKRRHHAPMTRSRMFAGSVAAHIGSRMRQLRERGIRPLPRREK